MQFIDPKQTVGHVVQFAHAMQLNANNSGLCGKLAGLGKQMKGYFRAGAIRDLRSDA